jgi:hypothetical protein
MPVKGLKYMNKVDLEKDAATEPFLHVRLDGRTDITQQLLTTRRTDGTQTV